jgi:hypothetical protein
MPYAYVTQFLVDRSMTLSVSDYTALYDRIKNDHEWPEHIQSRQTVKHCRESRGTRNQEPLCGREPAAV